MPGNYASITREGRSLTTELDGVIIQQVLDCKIGGCVVDTTDYPLETITAGSLVIYSSTDKKYKLMPIVEDEDASTDDNTVYKYDSLPDNYAYYGVVRESELKRSPFVSVVIRGKVNYKACPIKIDSILSAVKSALPHIIFTCD